jgi:phosphohistidine phosphatase
VLAELGAEPKVKYERELYLASLGALRRCLQRGAKGVSQLMLIGHNPGLHALALDLAGTGDRADLTRLAAKLPTAGLVVLELVADDWGDVRSRKGRLALFAAPKLLASRD